MQSSPKRLRLARLPDLAAAALFLSFLLPARESPASPWDLFGLGSRARAMAGAVVASTSEWDSAYYNPAAIVESPKIGVSFGYTYNRPVLKINGRDTDVEGTEGLEFGYVLPQTLAGVRLATGTAIHIPDKRVARFLVLSREQIRFAMYSNLTQRITTNLPLAVQVAPWLDVAAGLHFIGDNVGGIDFTIRQEGFGATEGSLLSAQVAVFAPIAGVLVKPWPGARIGIAYRSELKIRLDTPVTLRFDPVVLDPIPVPVIQASLLDVSALTITHFSPHQVAVGLAWNVTETLLVEFDATWMNWSAYIPDIPDTHTVFTGGLADLVPTIPEFAFPKTKFHDTVNPAIGIEWRALQGKTAGLMARGGYAFRMSPAPEQRGETNLVDANTHSVTAGLGLSLSNLSQWLAGPFSIDTHVALQFLEDRAMEKTSAADPIGSYRASGYVWGTGVSITGRF